jgi:single-strand DNA-binding protein
MAFDVVGKLHVAGETKQVSERFSKREFVLEVADGKYPQFVSFQLTGDRVSALDDHQVGDQIRVTFNLRGREWKNPQGEVKYFNSLDVWKLESARQNDQRGASAGNGGGNGGNGARRTSNDDFAYRDDPRPGDLAGASGRDDDLPF